MLSDVLEGLIVKLVDKLVSIWYKKEILSLRDSFSSDFVTISSLNTAVYRLNDSKFDGKEFLTDEWLHVFSARAVEFISRVRPGMDPWKSQVARVLRNQCSWSLFHKDKETTRPDNMELMNSLYDPAYQERIKQRGGTNNPWLKNPA